MPETSEMFVVSVVRFGEAQEMRITYGVAEGRPAAVLFGERIAGAPTSAGDRAKVREFLEGGSDRVHFGRYNPIQASVIKVTEDPDAQA